MLITNFKKLPYQISNIYKYVCTHLYQYKKKRIISYHTITYQSYTMHIYIYMYHVLSPVYPVYPHTIASHMFVCMYVCMHACMYIPYPIVSVLYPHYGWLCTTLCWLHQFCQVLSYIGGFLKWWIPKPRWLSILKWSSRTGWNGGTHHDFGNLHISCSLVTTINH